MTLRRISVGAVAVALLVLSLPALAQEESITTGTIALTSPYTGIAVEPGDSATFQLDISGPGGERIQLGVIDLPTGWTAEFRGGSLVVSEVTLEADGSSPNLRLQVEVPEEAAEGDYTVAIGATGPSGSDTLELSLEVALAVGGGVSLTTDFPALRGPADVTFNYTLELSNDTAEEITFGLETQGPPGWQIEARPSGQSRASTVTVESGDSSRITVEVDPSDLTPTGVYSVIVQASGGGETAEAELITQITGNFAIQLETSDQRLNVEAVAGEVSELGLVVFNTGTADLIEVDLRATTPRGWEVEFEPESIPAIEAGGFAEVTAKITPSGNAVAGDYRITFTASVPEARDSIEVRATVETSLLWGLVGVGVILVALAGLALVFRRYGRR
jgi:uncharacterized membrane protein